MRSLAHRPRWKNRSQSLLLVVLSVLLTASPAQAVVPDPKGDPEAFFIWADETNDDHSAGIFTTSLDDLRDALEAAIAAHPKSANLYVSRWRLFTAECDSGGCVPEEGTSMLKKAVDLDPGNLRAWTSRVLDALRRDCAQCARTYIEEARRLDPNSPYVYEAGARLQEALGFDDSAITLYLQSIASFATPQKKWTRYTRLSDLYAKKGNRERQIWALEKALEVRPDSPWSYGNLATEYLMSLGDYQRAIPLFRRALDKMVYGSATYGLSIALWERWGDAYLKRAQASEQSAYLAEAMSVQPDKEAAFLESTVCVCTGHTARALLASKQVPKSVLERRNSARVTPLVSAVIQGNRPFALDLLDAGADIDARDTFGNSVAYYAAKRGDRALFDALVAKHADFRATSNGNSPLIAAASGKDFPEDRLSIARFLVANGAAVEAVGSDGQTALAWAARAGSPEMVRFLLSKGAKADRPNAQGINPPALALVFANLPAFKVFVEERAGLDSKVFGRETLLEFAESHRWTEIAEMIRAAQKR